MSYVRSQDVEGSDPEAIRALSRLFNLNVLEEDINSLAISLADQTASMRSLERLDHESRSTHY
jgi:(p)ppGpp synthase/HD superfamily hydrolase